MVGRAKKLVGFTSFPLLTRAHPLFQRPSRISGLCRVAQLVAKSPLDYAPHQAVMGQLSSMRRKGQLRHALMFVGPEGVGKWLWAMSLAREVLCLASGEAKCVCASCDKVADHPDLMIMGPESDSLKIEPVREMIARCQLRPLVSQRRVVLIRDAHLLTIQAQNALLKTLEEPPGGTVFFVITHRERSMLPTIRSRCQLVRFSPLDAAALGEALRGTLSDQQQVDAALASAAAGSANIAVELLNGEPIEPLKDLLRASAKKRLDVAERLGKEHELTLHAARRYAVELRRFVQDGQPGQRAVAHRLFLDLSELVRASESNGNRRLLWERWLLSAMQQRASK